MPGGHYTSFESGYIYLTFKEFVGLINNCPGLCRTLIMDHKSLFTENVANYS